MNAQLGREIAVAASERLAVENAQLRAENERLKAENERLLAERTVGRVIPGTNIPDAGTPSY